MSSDLLRRLVDVTSLPPSGVDVDTLLVAFTQMFEARQALLETVGPASADTPHARALLVELAARDAAWASALAAALDTVGAARQNANRLRTYAR